MYRALRFLCLGALAYGLASACLAQDYQATVPQIARRIFDCKLKIQKLGRERELALDEMRQGLFCSQCNRSKSEIERAGKESFPQHLQRVHGHAVANPQMLADKAAFYDRQIKELQDQIARLEAMKTQLADSARQQADLDRLRADAERRRQELAAQEERLRQLQAQQEKLSQERQRIVQNANGKAQSYQQAGQAAGQAIRQAGNVIVEKMRQDAADAEQQRQQERNNRQMEQLNEKLEESKNALAQMQAQQPQGNPSGSDPDLLLPPPVETQEPPSEEQIARHNADTSGGLFTGETTSGDITATRERADSRGTAYEGAQRLGDLAGTPPPDEKPPAARSATPVDDAVAKLNLMGQALQAQHDKTERDLTLIKERSALETIYPQGILDNQSATLQGDKSLIKADIGAGAKLIEGATEIGIEASPALAPYKQAYNALQASGKVLAPGENNFERPLNASEALVKADETGSLGVPSKELPALGKLNDAAGAVFKTAGAVQNANNGNTVEAITDAESAVANAASFGELAKLNSGAAILAGATKVYSGANGIIENQQIKKDIAAYNQALSAGLSDQAQKLKAKIDAQQAQSDADAARLKQLMNQILQPAPK